MNTAFVPTVIRKLGEMEYKLGAITFYIVIGRARIARNDLSMVSKVRDMLTGVTDNNVIEAQSAHAIRGFKRLYRF